MPLLIAYLFAALVGAFLVGLGAALNIWRDELSKNEPRKDRVGKFLTITFAICIVVCITILILFPPCSN